MSRRIKVLVLLSGGLDSILAVRVLQEQNMEVVGITFKSYFFDSLPAEKAARQLGIELKIIDFGEEHWAMVKNPRYGYGKAMNPCIDCHTLMLIKAREIMEREGYAAVATGEVLGERPMSQNKNSLQLIEKNSGLKGYLLRPLSAKLLEPTVSEQKGLIDREKLLDISGRGRKRQIELAAKWGIKEYPTPAGGCLLTDLGFGKRLKELLEKWPDADGDDIELLKVGRHFWEDEIKIVVGRHQEDNQLLEKISKPDDVLVKLKDFPGPLTLIRGQEISEETIEKAAALTANYSAKAKNQPEIKVGCRRNKQETEIILGLKN